MQVVQYYNMHNLVFFIHYSSPTSDVCETGELAFPGSVEQLSEGPCKGDLGRQCSPGVGDGVRLSVRIFCAVLGWM